MDKPTDQAPLLEDSHIKIYTDSSSPFPVLTIELKPPASTTQEVLSAEHHVGGQGMEVYAKTRARTPTPHARTKKRARGGAPKIHPKGALPRFILNQHAVLQYDKSKMYLTLIRALRKLVLGSGSYYVKVKYLVPTDKTARMASDHAHLSVVPPDNTGTWVILRYKPPSTTAATTSEMDISNPRFIDTTHATWAIMPKHLMMLYGLATDPTIRAVNSFDEFKGAWVAGGARFMYMTINFVSPPSLETPHTDPLRLGVLYSYGDIQVVKISPNTGRMFNMHYVIGWTSNLKLRARRAIRSPNKKIRNWMKSFYMRDGFYMQFDLAEENASGYVICQTRRMTPPIFSGGSGGSGRRGDDDGDDGGDDGGDE